MLKRTLAFAAGVAGAMLLVAAALMALTSSSAVAAEDVDYRMGPFTLRNCNGTSPGDTRRQTIADPVNVVFFGPFASWQNSQRGVGYEYDYEDTSPPGITRGLEWRTTHLTGGSQHITNGAACSEQDSSSSRGSGVRRGTNAKRHTRYFEQILPFVAEPDGDDKSLLTVQDAHRDVKGRTCRGPGSLGRVNDRIPRKVDGFPDGGFNNAQRLFVKGFPRPGSDVPAVRSTDFRSVGRTPRRMRFIQCASEQPPKRYSVGWNGIVAFFYAGSRISCQDSWRPFDNDAWRFGDCPLGGREGHL